MSIGIEDADINKYVLLPFNLECMKLSAYYKKRRQFVKLAPFFCPERHTHYFYRKDFNDGDFPQNLLITPNLQYGGFAFSGDKYNQLDEAIELQKPDTELYELKEEEFKSYGARGDKIFKSLMKAEHCRLSLDNETIWSKYESQFRNLQSARTIIFHDYDLARIKGSYEIIREILKHARTDGNFTRVGMKFPIQLKDQNELLKWSSLPTNGTFYSLRYTGVMEDMDLFFEWVSSCKDKAVFSQIEYYITSPQYTENYFLETLLPKIFRQILISRSFHIFFSLKYDKGFFSDERWAQVLQLFNLFMNSQRSQRIEWYIHNNEIDTLFDFAKETSDKKLYQDQKYLTKSQIREIFNFVREVNYPLFKDFYECNMTNLGEGYDKFGNKISN